MIYFVTRCLAFLSLGLLAPASVWAANQGGIDIETATLTLPLRGEPRSLNSLTAESVSYTAGLMIHLQEGLMRYDGRRRLAGGVAANWNMSETELRFVLRDDARWQDGSSVTAHDFVYAWQQLVQPDTASPSANLASPILHASAILKGEKPASELGVRAESDRELVVSLAHPCAWCLKLFTNSIFYPLPKAFYEQFVSASGAGAADSYGTSKATHLSNGAYKIKSWQRGKQIRLEKNEAYWRRNEVGIKHLHFDFIGSDAKTEFNLFRAGEIAVAGLDKDTIPDALATGMRIRTHPTGHLFNIQFSHLNNKVSSNVHLRRAIAAVIDRDELVNKVVASPGTRVAHSMFHDWLTVGNTVFLDARPTRVREPDLAEARAHMQRARLDLGAGEIRMVLTINDSGLYQRIAEYFQQQLKASLDITLVIDPQMTQMMVQKWRSGETDMTLLTWPVDVDDPMDQISFLGNPDFRAVFKGLYAGDDMASLFYRNRDAIGEENRLNAVHSVDQFFHDKVTVLPLFESYGATVINPRLRGYVWQPVRGYADYRYLSIR